MTLKQVNAIKEAIRVLNYAITYPPKDSPRWAEDGFPGEYAYDEFAYKRIVTTYRDAMKGVRKHLRRAIKGVESVEGESNE